jgi:hypothetical protein
MIFTKRENINAILYRKNRHLGTYLFAVKIMFYIFTLKTK